jgi:DNA-binding Xre family transcriptional regulator
MLKLNIHYIATLRGYNKAYAFLMSLGISHNIAQRLAAGDTKKIPLDHLEKICIALRCTPNDLLDWQADNQAVDADHPLHALNRDTARLKNLEKLKSLPLDKLERLNELIGEME